MTPIEKQIQMKIEEVGTPLRDWDIQINFGIKTGFNEAFIIDTATRDRLIQEDSRSAEVIRPILRGRDIQRYESNFSGLWLINTHNGIKGKGIPPIDVNNYPAIKSHLDKYYPSLAKRADKGDTPYNLRNCVYTEDFSKQKIVWKRIGSILRFSYDESGTYSLDSTCFATGTGIKYLVAVLNSKMGKYLLKDSPRTGVGDLLISVQALEPIRIPIPDADQQDKIVNLLDEILNLCELNKDYSRQEEKLDELIYSLYGLIESEKEYVTWYVLSSGL